MKKKFGKIVSLAMALTMCGSIAACGGGGGDGDSDSPNTLDIYLLYKGYGDQWLTSTIELFKKSDFVKENYPDGITVKYTFDSNDGNARSKITNGVSVNKFDLLFGVNLKGFETTGLVADLTDSVYLAEVPGETGVKVIDKIPVYVKELINNEYATPRADGNESYYVVNYIDGIHGMLYNHDLLVETLNMEIPVTTNEFLATAAQIKANGYNSNAGNGTKTVIMNCADNGYWGNSFDLWWAQYEGYEGYENYFDGYDPITDADKSKAVLDQPGRLEALTVIDEVISQYSYASSQMVDYKQAQTLFLDGNGIFHYNGDYFSSEMNLELSYYESQNQRYDIRYMKMPVISSIVKTLEYRNGAEYMTDAMLSSIIKEIDNNVAYADSTAKTNGVIKADFDKIAEARCIFAKSAASGQVAVVPEYSPAKGLAADFLRFMYTEEAIRNFAIISEGILFPTTYDFMSDSEAYAKFDPIMKSKLDLVKGTSNYSFIRLPAVDATKLGAAGLTSLYFTGKFEVMFVQDEGNKMTPAEILEEEKKHWSDTLWAQMVANALE